ncbi:MAG TPA: 23S rRNA (pseudouridine(1915)-N(3))-methyltransferase RlmH [Patescibacteria group bacterium]|nr:23S rRNA (pseudouridine(1915)-N(3))-methyltransferase RlmH [Patescibacteria group bacterium]
MYSFFFLFVGKQKSGPFRDLAEEYLKRIGPYAKVIVREIPEESFRSEQDRERVLALETESIRAAIPDGALVVVLDASGKGMNSVHLSEAMAAWSEQERRTLAFVIGGPLGVHDALKKEADVLLSLSPMTFPHDLARVLLLEQLYRALMIQKRKTYHY